VTYGLHTRGRPHGASQPSHRTTHADTTRHRYTRAGWPPPPRHAPRQDVLRQGATDGGGTSQRNGSGCGSVPMRPKHGVVRAAARTTNAKISQCGRSNGQCGGVACADNPAGAVPACGCH